jgi:hypothetical protein
MKIFLSKPPSTAHTLSQIESLLGTRFVPGWESFSPKVGIYFIPAVTNNKSALKNISSVLMNNIPLLMNKVPLSQDLTCKSKKVPVERHFKRFGRLQEVTSDLT